MATVQTPAPTLAEVSPGMVRCLDVLATGDDSTRLRRLGVCQGRPLELVAHGDPMVLRVGGARIGVSRQLASLVLIDPTDH